MDPKRRARERRRDAAKDTKEREEARWDMAYRKAKEIRKRDLEKLKQAGFSEQEAKDRVGHVSRIAGYLVANEPDHLDKLAERRKKALDDLKESRRKDAKKEGKLSSGRNLEGIAKDFKTHMRGKRSSEGKETREKKEPKEKSDSKPKKEPRERSGSDGKEMSKEGSESDKSKKAIFDGVKELRKNPEKKRIVPEEKAQKHRQKVDGEYKSYKDAVKPKRIVEIPRKDGQKGVEKVYYYDCDHCGKEFASDKRKTNKRAFHNKECQFEWQKYGKPVGKMSAEGRQRASEATKRYWADPEHRKKRVKKMRDVMNTPEWKEKRKKTAKEVADRPEWREKQSLAHKGKKRPPEVGRKISEVKMGHSVSDETRRKISEALSGEKSRWWKGGVSSERERFYRSWRWRKKSEKIRIRDNDTCQGCGWTGKEAKGLGVHHIDPLHDTDHSFETYPDEMLVSLCKTCHAKTEEQDSRLKWPVNGRDDEARLDRLRYPSSRQTFL